MFYLTTEKHEVDHRRPSRANISETVPQYINGGDVSPADAPCWLGTFNNVRTEFVGTFETLDEAREKCVELGYDGDELREGDDRRVGRAEEWVWPAYWAQEQEMSDEDILEYDRQTDREIRADFPDGYTPFPNQYVRILWEEDPVAWVRRRIEEIRRERRK